MKKIITILSALLVAVTALAQREITIFTASDNLAKPIKVKAGGSTYTLYDEIQINKSVYSFEAWDANGNKIMPPSKSREYHSDSNKSNVTRYHFTTLYPSSTRSGSSSYSGGNNSYSTKKSGGRRGENIPEYEGDYSSAYYSNLEEYLMWRLPAPPASKPISNPEQYCGKWGSAFVLNRMDADDWSVDVSWDGSRFYFDFKTTGYELYKQESENCWLFRHESYTDKTPEMRRRNLSSFYDDCDPDADPGFPRTGTYKYDEYYQNAFYRLCLQGGAVKFGAVLGHTDYYFHDIHTYSETYRFDNIKKELDTYIKYVPYKERPCNAREHEAVDLGLSVLWATCNVGASTPEEDGDYFAWGETGYKFFYDWESLKYCTSDSGNSFSKYNGRDGRTRLSQEDDVASVVWGKGWRMPSADELEELQKKCRWILEEVNGILGYTIRGPSGNNIFLPLSGYKNNDGDLKDKGASGYYWSNSKNINDPQGALALSLEPNRIRGLYSYRYYGNSVRPVRNKSEAQKQASKMKFEADSLKFSNLKTFDKAKDYEKANAIASEIYNSSSGYWKGKAAYYLGMSYWYGDGVSVDLDKAYSYFMDSHEEGDNYAAVALGELAYFNDYSPDDNVYSQELAKKWFQIAIENDMPGGYWGMALLNYQNFQTVDKALEYMKIAADRGLPIAQAHYGRYVLLFERPKEAKEYFQKAMDAGKTMSFSNKLTTMCMLCDFCMSHPQYSIFWSFCDGACYVPEITEEEEDVVVGVIKDKYMGFLKLSYDGNILASTPIIYDCSSFPYYDEEKGLFKVYIPYGPVDEDGYQEIRDIWVDINGKEVKEDVVLGLE